MRSSGRTLPASVDNFEDRIATTVESYASSFIDIFKAVKRNVVGRNDADRHAVVVLFKERLAVRRIHLRVFFCGKRQFKPAFELEIPVDENAQFELSIKAFAPNMPIIAPWREWDIKTREEEIEYADARGATK